MEIEIPDPEKRFCFECSTQKCDDEIKSIDTIQKPIKLEIRKPSRGCFSSSRMYKWKWKCTECGEIQF